jgi:hypothetical protein
VAASSMLQANHDAGAAFVASAGMLLGLLKPEASDEEREQLLSQALKKRARELASE